MEGFAETRDLVRRLQRVSESEIGQLIEPLPPATRQRLLDAFNALMFKSTNECSRCLGKLSKGVAACPRCEGLGRESKDVAIATLCRRVDQLERQLKQDHESGDAAVGPI